MENAVNISQSFLIDQHHVILGITSAGMGSSQDARQLKGPRSIVRSCQN